MAKSSKTKTAKKRVKIGKLSTTKTKLTEKDMKKVSGGGSGDPVPTESISFNVIGRRKPIGTA